MAGISLPSNATVSLANGSKAITLANANWYILGVKQGDTLRVNGLQVTIDTVPNGSAPQLLYAWTGAAVAAQPYEVFPQTDAQTFAAKAMDFLAMATALMPSRLSEAGTPFSPDYYVGLWLLGIGTTTPPSTPVMFDAYQVGTGATGAWSGKGGSVAIYNGTGWRFLTPYPGLQAYDVTASAPIVWNGSAWARAGGGAASGPKNPGLSGQVTATAQYGIYEFTADGTLVIPLTLGSAASPKTIIVVNKGSGSVAIAQNTASNVVSTIMHTSDGGGGGAVLVIVDGTTLTIIGVV